MLHLRKFECKTVILTDENETTKGTSEKKYIETKNKFITVF